MDSLGDYWSLLVGALAIISISFITATLLSYIIPIQNKRDFLALRLSATFPNIVALPILIFPSLCEHPVVYENFGGIIGEEKAELRDHCVSQANTMVFSYSVVWTLLFYSLGHPALMGAAHMVVESASEPVHDNNHDDIHSLDLTVATTANNNSNFMEIQQGSSNHASEKEENTFFDNLWAAVKRTLKSPPFITTVVAFGVGCISPLRNLLFSQGGQLRFLGAATETIGRAASPIMTMVVAASLVPNKEQMDNTENLQSREESQNHEVPEVAPQSHNQRRPTLAKVSKSIRRTSVKALKSVLRTPAEKLRLYLWFTLSRLVLVPLFVVLIIAGLDCRGALNSVPDLAKLVLIVNAACPGALIVVVLLKSNPELHETAAVVTRVYLPTYILSIATIAGWTALGLIVAMPTEDGNPFCPR